MGNVRKGLEILPFGGLSATLEPTLIGPGVFASMEGTSIERGALETGPRYGDVWSRPSAVDGDSGRGIFLGQYGLSAEYLAIVKHDGDLTCTAYSVSTSGAWTSIATGLPDSIWTFRQYDDRIYCCAAGGGVWVHTLGWTSASAPDDGNLLFDPLPPTYTGVVSSAALSVIRPAYPTRPFTVSDTLTTFDTVRSGYCQVDDDTGELVVRTGVSSGSRKTLTQSCVVSLSASYDLSNVDYLAFTLTSGKSGSYAIIGTQGGPDPDLDNASPTAGTNAYGEQGLSITSDHTTTITQAWIDGQTFVPLSIYGTTTGTKTVVADLRGVSSATRADVRRLVLRIVVSYEGSSAEVRMSPVYVGGAAIYDWTSTAPTAPELEYGIAFRNPTTGELSHASKTTLGAGQSAGTLVQGAKRPLGAWVRATVATNATLATAGFTKIGLYRSLPLPVGRVWHRVDEANNTGSTVDLTDKVANVDLAARATGALVFGEVDAEFTAEGLGVWKQHLLILADRKLFASWADEPSRFLPPPEEDFSPPDESETTQGRTLYVAYDKAEPAIAAVEGDLLYLAGPRTTSVMIGDSMLTATPPRRLPGSRGILGHRAMCSHDNGALLGSYDGLWYVEASRAFTGGADNTYRIQELTDNVRQAWLRLLASAVKDAGDPDPSDFATSIGGTGTDVSRASSTVAWTNPGNAQLGVDVATATLPLNTRTHWLTVSNLNPSSDIPDEADVYSVNLVVKHKATGSLPATLDTVEVLLSGVVVSTLTPGTVPTSTMTEVSFSLDLVALGITIADINAGNVSVRVGYSGWVGSSTAFLPASWNVSTTADQFQYGRGTLNATQGMSASATWIGVGSPPPFISLALTARASGSGRGGSDGGSPPSMYATGYTGTASVDNGIGATASGSIMAPSPDPPPASRDAESTAPYTVPVVGLSGIKSITMTANVSVTPSGTQDATGSFHLSAVVGAVTPAVVSVEEVRLDVQYSTPGESEPGVVDPSRLVVVSWEDEIWVFNGGRYLRLTRPLADGNRQWEEGPFAQVDSVAAAAGYGARAMLRNGQIVRLWRDSSNVRYESDGGTSVLFSATTGWIPSGRRQLVNAFVRAVGTPNLLIESDDGVKGVDSQLIPITSDRRQPLRVGKGAGTQYRFTFSGRAGRDKFLDLYLEWEDATGNGT